MKKAWPTIFLILCFLVGLSLMLYPTVSNWWNSLHASAAIVEYAAAQKKLSDEDYDALFSAAESYNQSIAGIDFPFMYYDQVPGYEEALNLDGSGIMGYITIETIRVELPIHHGTSEGVLQKAVGHLQGSSLPTGGAGNHCVLSAHRGLPSAKLFTDLDRIKEGDRFTLSVLNRELVYEVDQILVVEPQDVEALYRVDGEDYCTLVTCTPYGVNSHRLLVRGKRVEEEMI
ncbi:MAG: class C sortase [Oscillospiraceae bacterium]|nr:class C sortase [Oscillospiraceae bacterium]